MSVTQRAAPARLFAPGVSGEPAAPATSSPPLPDAAGPCGDVMEGASGVGLTSRPDLRAEGRPRQMLYGAIDIHKPLFQAAVLVAETGEMYESRFAAGSLSKDHHTYAGRSSKQHNTLIATRVPTMLQTPAPSSAAAAAGRDRPSHARSPAAAITSSPPKRPDLQALSCITCASQTAPTIGDSFQRAPNATGRPAVCPCGE
jgi:hypothetical protein